MAKMVEGIFTLMHSDLQGPVSDSTGNLTLNDNVDITNGSLIVYDTSGTGITAGKVNKVRS